MTENADPPRVLVVHDDQAVLHAQARALADRGYLVATAGGAEAAMAAVGDTSFDAIVSEIDARGTDGLALLERARGQDIPVILMTRNPDTDTAIRAIERGALRYLIEPVGLPELVRVVDDAVSLHGIVREHRRAKDHAAGRAGPGMVR